jgi:hypothetical protein
MRNVYFLIEESAVTQRIVNLSVSRNKAEMPRILKKGLLVNKPYLIVEAEFREFPEDLLDYQPFTTDELLAEIEGPDWVLS